MTNFTDTYLLQVCSEQGRECKVTLSQRDGLEPKMGFGLNLGMTWMWDLSGVQKARDAGEGLVLIKHPETGRISVGFDATTVAQVVAAASAVLDQ